MKADEFIKKWSDNIGFMEIETFESDLEEVLKPKCKELEQEKASTKALVIELSNEITSLKEQLEKAKNKYCRCSEEETTGSTTFECCNICGKILTSKT